MMKNKSPKKDFLKTFFFRNRTSVLANNNKIKTYIKSKTTFETSFVLLKKATCKVN